MKCIMFFCRLFIIYILYFCGVLVASDVQKNMVLIPDGVYYPLFKVDNDEYGPIDVESFYIDSYPVTNKEFKYFIKLNIAWAKDNVKVIFADKNYLCHWDDIDFNVISDCPVINVSWFAADAYCCFFNKRLPFIHEWEYVACSGKVKNNNKYLQDILEWYSGTKSYLVKASDMNKDDFGVYGMHGVVWEWISDFNSVILLNPDIEGGGLEEVLYCGAVASKSIDPSDYVSFMRFAFRNSLEADYTMVSLGFRCAKNID